MKIVEAIKKWWRRPPDEIEEAKKIVQKSSAEVTEMFEKVDQTLTAVQPKK